MKRDILLKEIRFKTSRSGGPGGQHANKVSTKVTLLWNPAASQALSEKEKERVVEKWKEKFNQEGDYSLEVTTTRSQSQNKTIAITRLCHRLEMALEVPKTRKLTKPSHTSIKKRLKIKKIKAERKRLRGNRDWEF